MVAAWLRNLAIALVVVVPAISLAASPPTETPQPRNPVADGTLSHNTGMLFPKQIGTLTRYQIMDFEAQYPGRGLGTGYRYSNEQGLRIDIYLYDYREQVPDGIEPPQIRSEVQRSSGEIDTMQARGYYEDVRHTPIETCRAEGIEFLCEAVLFTVVLQGGQGGKLPSTSMLFLRGTKGHYLKLRMTWPQAALGQDQEGKAFVDAFLKAQPK